LLTLRVNQEGNITLPLPLKNDQVIFPNNRSPVYHRQVNTLNKIKTDHKKLLECQHGMQKNIDSGHVEEIPSHEIKSQSCNRTWYIPVFAVTHPKKQKIRLVFDSAATYNGVSLNNELLQGPDINTRLTTVLLRFREKSIAFTADIESMFYAFHLETTDRDLTRFFWWKDNDHAKNLVEYRATRHIFGNRSSPSLANIGLRYAVSNSSNTSLLSKRFVFENFYVDDGCGSASTAQEAIDILKETRAALGSFNIRLHKISSSSPEVLRAFPPSELNESLSSKTFNHLDAQRTLGVEWNPSSDSFVVRTNVPSKPYTKRGTLATTNSLFDPIGFVSPVVLSLRLLQRFFIPPKNGDSNVVQLGWDDPLPEEHRNLWDGWIQSLRSFDGKVEIPRSLYPADFGSIVDQTLHVFCDASESGIGCVLYLRSVNSENRVHVSFVVGSSRIAPRGTTSIPRLELCASLEASQLATKVTDDLKLDPDRTCFYSDSCVVLGYLRNTQKRFSRYVSNRVAIILNSSEARQWRYIQTDNNPADIASRPQTFQSLLDSCWFRGPSFLWSPSLPEPMYPTLSDDLPEVVQETSSFVTVTNDGRKTDVLNETFHRVSSWLKLVNIVKIVVSFIIRASESAAVARGACIVRRPPVSSEFAVHTIIKAVQNEFYPRCFPEVSSVPSNLSSLCPFIDNSLLKVGGRLKHSKLPQHVKYPILLPPDSHVTKLLISHYHNLTKHQGRTVLLSAIREAGYYIYHGASAIRKFLRGCVTCNKLRGTLLQQKMNDLPSDRVEQCPPFTYVGMDVFGHYNISEGTTTRRNNSVKKVWAVVFICLVTKAVHVEALSSMDTSSFKLALRRFFCIRGVCRKLRSDRGTNFVGAKNQEENLNFDSFKEEAEKYQCQWEFNPPHASHFGGIWERSIGSFRRILDASLLILGKRLLSREEFQTYLQEAACIINSTPMYEVSSDPNDHLPVTPASLMTLKDNPNPPPLENYDARDLLAYGTRRWRRVQALSDNFWCRWRGEYLQELQNRQKWTNVKPNLRIGDVVILKVKNTRRNTWPMARVVAVKTSKDDLVRSATVALPNSTGSGIKTLDRPVSEMVLILKNGS